jgi:hypothetical protein
MSFVSVGTFKPSYHHWVIGNDIHLAKYNQVDTWSLSRNHNDMARWQACIKECTRLGIRMHEQPQVVKHGLERHMVVLIPVSSWKGDMLRVIIWLVITMSLSPQHPSFRLRNSSTTPSIQMSIVIGSPCQLRREKTLPSCNSVLRSTWANRHNSRQGCRLEEFLN